MKKRVKGLVVKSRTRGSDKVFTVRVDDINHPLLTGRNLEVHSVENGVELVLGRRISFSVGSKASTEGSKLTLKAFNAKFEDDVNISIAVIEGPRGTSICLDLEGKGEKETKKFHQKESGGLVNLVGFVSLRNLAEAEPDPDIRHGLTAIDSVARLPGVCEALEKILDMVYSLNLKHKEKEEE